jgi:hypothetical protein
MLLEELRKDVNKKGGVRITTLRHVRATIVAVAKQ